MGKVGHDNLAMMSQDSFSRLVNMQSPSRMAVGGSAGGPISGLSSMQTAQPNGKIIVELTRIPRTKRESFPNPSKARKPKLPPTCRPIRQSGAPRKARTIMTAYFKNIPPHRLRVPPKGFRYIFIISYTHGHGEISATSNGQRYSFKTNEHADDKYSSCFLPVYDSLELLRKDFPRTDIAEESARVKSK